ncbi:hypothetical protein LZ30DRAFT_692395 [Colletotrichum cereale]|nr:hypothetical protein LZ30DRAFT_692395 [Colletotrichum cereale]
MILQCLLVLFLAFSPLHSPGNAAYSADVQKSSNGRIWSFVVQSDGYKVFDGDGDRKPLDYLEVDTWDKRLTVYTAMNGFDRANPRLKMRQVLKLCWTMTGLRPGDIREVKGVGIQNTDMLRALMDCRDGMGLGRSDDFTVSAADTNTAKKSCWGRLGRTIFSSSIQGAISNFGLRKRLVQVRVDNSWRGDDIYYYFS